MLFYHVLYSKADKKTQTLRTPENIRVKLLKHRVCYPDKRHKHIIKCLNLQGRHTLGYLYKGTEQISSVENIDTSFQKGLNSFHLSLSFLKGKYARQFIGNSIKTVKMFKKCLDKEVTKSHICRIYFLMILNLKMCCSYILYI